MLGLGNTLSGGIVPAAAAASFSNTKSIDFDGVDDYVDLGDSDVFSFGDGSDDSAFSISLWYKMSDVTSAALIAKTGTVSAEREWYLNFGSNDKIYFGCLDESVGKPIYIYSSYLTSTEGSWTHLVVTYDGSEHPSGQKMYINGSAVSVTEKDNATYVAMENTAYDVWIGGYQALSKYATGNIDEVAIFNAELSAAEVTAVYNGGAPTDLSSESNLVGYWRMGDGATYPTIPDDSSNSNDGTMTNMASGDLVEDVPG